MPEPRDPNEPASSHKAVPPEDSEAVDLLARAGGNDRVLGKKVLLAALASAEAERLGLSPAAGIDSLARVLRRELALEDDAEFAAWLHAAGLQESELRQVLADFAAVLTVESALREDLAERLSRHRRLVQARAQRLTRLNGAA